MVCLTDEQHSKTNNTSSLGGWLFEYRAICVRILEWILIELYRAYIPV